jgi:hypothetical protein
MPRLGCALACGSVFVAAASRAEADVTSWLYAGGGVASSAMADSATEVPGVFAAETGMGSAPDKDVIVGGLFKSLTYFGQGTDLGLAVRGASGGFVRGGFGLALDLGGYVRLSHQASQGFLGALVFGGPLGLQLAAITEIGSNDYRIYGATLGIDFLRLTVYRTATQRYFPNPFPPSGLGRRQ